MRTCSFWLSFWGKKCTYWRRHHIQKHRGLYQSISIWDCPQFYLFILCQQKCLHWSEYWSTWKIVDGINVCDKRHLKQYMKIINHTQKETRTEILNLTWLIKNKLVSLDDECRRHCLEGQTIISKCGIKHKKRRNRKQSNKHTILWQKLTTEQSITSWLKNLPRRACPKKNMMHSGIHGHWHIQCDSFLGVDHQDARIIPCCCESCIEMIKSDWLEGKEPAEQTNFQRNEQCKHTSVFSE